MTTSAAAPLVLGDAWAVERLPQGGAFTGNGDDVAHVQFDRFGVATRFRAIGIPYLLAQGLKQDAGGDLTVDAGVELRVAIASCPSLAGLAPKPRYTSTEVRTSRS